MPTKKKVNDNKISPKEKFTQQIHKAVKAKKEKSRDDIKVMMEKAGYSTKSAAAVAQWYDLYTFGRAIHLEALGEEPAKKIKAEPKKQAA